MSRTYGNTNVNVSGGMGLIGWLQILFIGLKLTNHITWPWIWVLAPLWISTLIGVIVFIGIGIWFYHLYKK